LAGSECDVRGDTIPPLFASWAAFGASQFPLEDLSFFFFFSSLVVVALEVKY